MTGIKQGWAFFEELAKNATNDEEREKIHDLHNTYEVLFASTEGKIVLADLERRFIDPDVLTGYYPCGINTAISMAERAAQIKLVRMLKTMSKPGEENARIKPKQPTKRKPK